MNDIVLVELLEQLRVRLNNSKVEMTVGLGKALGKDCANYKKALRVFCGKDKADILRLVDGISNGRK